MFLNEERIILANPDILSETHLPPDIYARDPQLKEIGICLQPITEGRKIFSSLFWNYRLCERLTEDDFDSADPYR